MDSLDPDSRPKALERARHLGRVLHTMQDFYAHSNWVEHGRTDLSRFEVGTVACAHRLANYQG